jgi:hypothetical protein
MRNGTSWASGFTPFSVLIAIAKARVWASEGWLVVISDGKGKSFGPAEFDDLLSFPTR